ncbi:MAG: hypothetical protein GY717_18740 [Rhodobacteraceae bacterium]|nr:hypothetical protein [Paracoccaceae bacterium]
MSATTTTIHRLIAVAALLWYLVCAADYLAFRLMYVPYLSYFTADQIAYFTGLPAWITAAWAISVWSGLAGAVVLWSRGHAAAALFALSFAGLMAATVGLVYVVSPPVSAVAGQNSLWVLLGALAAAFVLLAYAREQNRRQY